ncbi:hypothetical protein T12_2211, partial [Trichinella patagoniensis]
LSLVCHVFICRKKFMIYCSHIATITAVWLCNLSFIIIFFKIKLNLYLEFSMFLKLTQFSLKKKHYTSNDDW